jgi:hypothetical protein
MNSEAQKSQHTIIMQQTELKAINNKLAAIDL